MNIATITALLGWCSTINIGLLFISAAMIMLARQPLMRLHSRASGVDSAQLPGYYFSFLAYFKLAILLFNLVPYIALRIIA